MKFRDGVGALFVSGVGCGRLMGGDVNDAAANITDTATLDAKGDASIADEASVVLGCGVQPNAPWPMVAHDPMRTGRSDVDGPRTKQIRWTLSYTTDRDFNSSPAVAADGTIYLEKLVGALLAVNPDGTEKWTANGVGNYGSPTIGCDGTIFVEGLHRYDDAQHTWVDDLLVAFTPSGKLIWTLTDVAPISMDDNGPALAPNGLLYYARAGLYGIGVDGTLKFHLVGDFGSPRVALDDAGVAYGGLQVGDAGSALSFGADGGVRWEHMTGVSQGMLLPDGTFVAASHDAITAYSPIGIVLWSTPTNYARTIAVASSGRIYAGTPDGIIAIDATTHASTLLHSWVDYYDGYMASVVVDASGWVYGSLNHHVVALAPDDSLAFDLDLGADYIDGTSLALSNGTLYVAAYQHLIAIGP